MSLVAVAVIGANVRLLRPLKRGGMGSVWLAEHLTLRTQVAVKFMAEALAQDHEFVARFSREAMVSAQIKSPHVVQVFDHGIAPDGTPYIVMELLEGEDLRTRLARVGTIGVEETAAVVVQVGRALSKAHAAGIVHRDIKPDNVFLTDQDGELFVKVLDFGIAKHAAQESEFGVTGTGAMVGTPHYMSPEQILSARRAEPRSDLWSLGVVAYRCLTGQVPFQGETLGAVCIAIEKGNFVPPSQMRPGLPPSLDAWFQRVLVRDPAQRFASAKEMADALVAALQAGPSSSSARLRLDTNLVGLPLPAPSGPGAPIHMPTPAPGWTSPVPPTPAPRSAPMAMAVAAPGLEAGGTPPPFAPPPGNAFVPPADPSWPSASGAAVAQPHTFHGASVTQADWKGASRRALVAVVFGALGVLMLVAIVIALLVKGSGATAAADAASASPPRVAAPAPLPTETAAPGPAAIPSAAPTAQVASAAPPPTAPPTSAAPPSVVRPTTTKPTGRPKRDYGF